MSDLLDDEQVLQRKLKERESRKRFYAKHGERIRAEARERYHKFRTEDPMRLKNSWKKWREKNKEAYNEYHKKYRKREGSPQLKGEFAKCVRRSAASAERKIEKAILKAQLHIVNVHKVILTRREMVGHGQKALTIKEARAYIRSLKTDKLCSDCQRPFPFYVFDFDHREPGKKVRNLASIRLSDGFFTTEDIDKEVAKCDLVCSNCHRIRTFNRPKRSRFKNQGSEGS